MINIVRKSANLASSLRNIVIAPRMNFSGDSWKDRDEAAEKVYISRKQKQAIKKLLDQVEKQQLDRQTNTQQFESRLVQIMQRYKIENQALKAQIAHLHLQLRQ